MKLKKYYSLITDYTNFLTQPYYSRFIIILIMNIFKLERMIKTKFQHLNIVHRLTVICLNKNRLFIYLNN